MDLLSFISVVFLRAALSPNTMNKLVKVSKDSAPPCNQSTLDSEVPYFTFAVSDSAYQSQNALSKDKKHFQKFNP